MSTLDDIIQTAIEEWSTIQGGPTQRPHNPTLAHYIATQISSVHENLRIDVFEFLRQADRRADGCGDLNAYHSARHALVMSLSERDPSDPVDSGAINEDNSRRLGAHEARSSTGLESRQ